MASKYTKHSTGREWRRGIYRIEPLPKLSPADWKHPRQTWGCSVGKFSGGETTELELLRLADGLAVVALCRFCGGRNEALVPTALADVPADFERMLMPFGPWREQHEHCNEKVIVWRTPALVEEFVHTFLATARQDLARGGFIPHCMHLLTTDGRACSFFPPALPQYEDAARITTEEFRASVRGFIRQRKLDLLGAVFTSEAWFTLLREGEPERQDGLSVGYVTADYGKLSLYPIHRDTSGATSGPGKLLPDEANLHGVPVSARLLDTLLA